MLGVDLAFREAHLTMRRVDLTPCEVGLTFLVENLASLGVNSTVRRGDLRRFWVDPAFLVPDRTFLVRDLTMFAANPRMFEAHQTLVHRVWPWVFFLGIWNLGFGVWSLMEPPIVDRPILH